jgi:CheY-like chemotaxis protein
MTNPGAASVRRIALSVEDDAATRFLIRQVFEEIGSGLELQCVLDGKYALDFLKQSGDYKDAPRPNLILLDMNLPRMSGPDLLTEMQADDFLRGIPVVVFSSSKLDADCAKCLALGARQFITKPSTYDEFVSAIKSACSLAEAR